MIFSQASNLQTRQRVWIPRDTDLGPQRSYDTETPYALESEWIAGVYSDKYKEEALNALPNFN